MKKKIRILPQNSTIPPEMALLIACNSGEKRKGIKNPALSDGG